MTWREVSDLLSQEWKMLVEHRPALSRELIENLPTIDRDVDLVIEDFITCKRWPPTDDDILEALFLRVDFALQFSKEAPADDDTGFDRGNTLHVLLMTAWYEDGYKALRDSLN